MSNGSNMPEAEVLLEFAEDMTYTSKGVNLSDLQRTILLTSLQGNRTTYDQLAEDCGYSSKYIKQDIAPKLWQLLSEILEQKITKTNVRSALEREMRKQPTPQPNPIPAMVPEPSDIMEITADITESPKQKGNILLVDDQPNNLRLLSDLLEEQGYSVQQAINGNVALQAAAIAPPDLILLDIHMPDVDGFSVCQSLKADPKTHHIPVIFVSALDETWDKVKAFSVGAVDYITKPFKLVEVLARVKNQLEMQRLQQKLRTQNAQLQQALQELQRLAAIDPVTQVASRHRFNDYIQVSWDQGSTATMPLSLVMCRVSGLEQLNENHGRQAGDQCLYRIGQLLQSGTRPQDLVCRYAGVTLAVILPNLEREQVQTRFDQVLQDFRLLDLNLPVLKMSIGASTVIPQSDSQVQVLIEKCDQALQQAKEDSHDSLVIL